MLHTFKIYHICYGERQTREKYDSQLHQAVMYSPKRQPFVVKQATWSLLRKLFAFFPCCRLSHNFIRKILDLSHDFIRCLLLNALSEAENSRHDSCRHVYLCEASSVNCNAAKLVPIAPKIKTTDRWSY